MRRKTLAIAPIVVALAWSSAYNGALAPARDPFEERFRLPDLGPDHDAPTLPDVDDPSTA